MGSYWCINPDCAYSETGICARAAEFPGPEPQCEDLRESRFEVDEGTINPYGSVPPGAEMAANSVPEAAAEAETTMATSRFWSGSALGGDEAGALLWDPRSKLFTIMGGEDRGKTCFLTAFYIQLANGYTAGFPWRFCGSRSLRGFQSLTDTAFKWKGGEEGIAPRTSQASFRQPSFLHVALKPDTHHQAPPTHMLLTDMPGAWFERWIDSASDGLPDTLEFLPRSDGFLVILDAPKLLEDRLYQNDVGYLLDRLIAFLRLPTSEPKPIALVLAKYDGIAKTANIPDEKMRREAKEWRPLESSLAELFARMEDLPEGSPWDVFPCAAFSHPGAQPVGVLAPFAFLLKMTARVEQRPHLVIQPHYRGSFFEVFREGGL